MTFRPYPGNAAAARPVFDRSHELDDDVFRTTAQFEGFHRDSKDRREPRGRNVTAELMGDPGARRW